MSFEQLAHVAMLGFVAHNRLVFEWQDKRAHLLVYMQDLLRLADDYKNADKRPYELNSMITLVDQVPRIRLSSACEGAVNCLYGMAEIAAQFSNKASKGLLPSSFNALRKKAERGDYHQYGMSEWLSDFEWYKKVREIRTEWVHFSTVFTAENTDGEVILVVRCHRRPSDREEFRQQIEIGLLELIEWIRKAIALVDNLGNYLLVHHIIPSLDLEAKVTGPRRDHCGWPIVKPDHRFEVEQITVAEHLMQCGIRVGR